MECIFCSIAEGTAPSWSVYEDEVAVAFLDIGQATPGHTLVRPTPRDTSASCPERYPVERFGGLARGLSLPRSPRAPVLLVTSGSRLIQLVREQKLVHVVQTKLGVLFSARESANTAGV